MRLNNTFKLCLLKERLLYARLAEQYNIKALREECYWVLICMEKDWDSALRIIDQTTSLNLTGLANMNDNNSMEIDVSSLLRAYRASRLP